MSARWPRAAGATAARRVRAVRLRHERVSPKTVWTFVHILADDGRWGVGEASLMRDPASLDAPFAALASAARGETLADLHRRSRAMAREEIAEAAIASALEQALWDLAARVAGLDVASMLGPVHAHTIPLYANINRRTVERTPRAVAASAREAAAAGFSRFKFAPFDDLTPADDGSATGRDRFEAGIARITALREALGREAELYVDCHWRFGVAGAKRAIDALAALGVVWFECPLPEESSAIADVVTLRSYANANGMRLAGLEALTSRDAFAPWLAAGAYDVVMPDVKYCGGIEELIAIGEDAMAAGLACAPHNPSGPVSHAASLVTCAHLVAPVLLEHQWDETPRFYELAGPGLPVPAGGACTLPAGPGLGSGPGPGG